MNSRRWEVWIGLAVLASAACGDRVAGAREAAPAAAAMATPLASGHAATAAHGDHSPHHGGTVLMERDLHYEIVIEPTGRYAVYFTDAMRADLPASTVSGVVIEIDRQQGEIERVPLAIDAAGECWEAKGAPVKTLDASIHVGFTFNGDRLGVDLPFKSVLEAGGGGEVIAINLWIAVRALAANRLQALLTLCGMSVGIAMVVVVAGLGRGAQSSIESQLEEAGPTVVTVRAGNFVPAAIIPNGEQDSSGGEPGEASESALDVNVPTVRRHEPAGRPSKHRSPAPPLGAAERHAIGAGLAGVKAVAASVEGNARRGDGGVVRVHGLEAAWPEIKGWKLREGKLFAADDYEAGADVAIVMPAAVRRLWPNQSSSIGRTLTVAGRSLRIVGVVDTAVPASDTPVVPSIYVPLPVAQSVLERESLDAITVQTASVAETTRVAAAIGTRLRELRGLPADTFDDFRVETQTSAAFTGRGMDPRLARAVAGNIAGFEQASYEEIARSLRQAGRTMTLLLVGAATVSLVVGGIGVMNIMLVSVTSRTREIGLRMAMGARTADVLVQFLAEAVALASTGGVIGLVIGVAGLVAAREGLRWATAVSPGTFFLALGVAALTGVAFGFGPARRAARLDPVVALRAE